MCRLRLQAAPSAVSRSPACGRDRGSSGARPRRRGRDRAAGGLAPGPSSPGLSGTMTPSSETEALVASLRYALGLTDAAQRLGAEALPAFVHAQGQALQEPTASCRRSSQRTPPLPGPAVTHHQQTELEPPAASGNRRRDPGSRRPAPAMTRIGNAHAGRSPDRRGHDRFGVTATRNQLCPSRSIREAPVVPVLDDGAQNIASEPFYPPHAPALYLLGRLGTRVGELLVTDCDHPGGRLTTRRQAGKIDGRCRSGDTDMGRSRCWAFPDTASYRFWRCTAFPPSPARPCRRDKILLGAAHCTSLISAVRLKTQHRCRPKGAAGRRHFRLRRRNCRPGTGHGHQGHSKPRFTGFSGPPT